MSEGGKGGGREEKGPKRDGCGEGWQGEGERGRAEIKVKTEDKREKSKLHDNVGDEYPGVICLLSWQKNLRIARTILSIYLGY